MTARFHNGESGSKPFDALLSSSARKRAAKKRFQAFRRFFDLHRHLVTGRVLVLGSKIYHGKLDRRQIYANDHEVVGLDLLDGDGVDVVHDFEQLPPADLGLFHHVDCCSTLEHVQRPWLFAENIERVLEPGGTLLVLVPWVWRVHDYPGDYWRMTPEALGVLFPGIRWVERAFISDLGRHKRVPACMRNDGSVWFARSELVAFGVKDLA